MSAILTRGKTFAATEQVTNTKLHQLIDSGTIANIDQTNIVASSGLVVQSASQPSDTDALWNDTGNNLLKFLRSGSYQALVDVISDQTVAGIKTFSGANIHNGVETFNEEIISGATLDSPPIANALYKENMPKGWINFNGTGTIAINDSFNVSSIVDNGTGDFNIVWNVDFANANYAAFPQVPEFHCFMRGFVAGNINIRTHNSVDVLVDADDTCVFAIGQQS